MPPKKKVTGLIKLQIQAGAATPAPPIGPALGQHGVNIMEFCKAYNAATESQRGNVVPVEITVYEDRSFTFITKTPPAAELIKKAAGVAKGSGEPHKTKVAKLTQPRSARSPDQDAGPQRQRPRRRREDHRRHRPLDGHHRRGLISPAPYSGHESSYARARGRAARPATTTPRQENSMASAARRTAPPPRRSTRSAVRPARGRPAGQGDPTAKYDATVEVAFRLGVDPRKADQMVRGTVNLPHGTGKTARVLVFATGERAEQAGRPAPTRSAGDDLIDKVAGRLTRLRRRRRDAGPHGQGRPAGQGPRPAWPHAEPEDRHRDDGRRQGRSDIKGGKIEFRVDKHANLHFIIGKASFSDTALVENYAAALDEVLRLKPSASKGRYIAKATITTTKGPGIPVDQNKTRNLLEKTPPDGRPLHDEGPVPPADRAFAVRGCGRPSVRQPLREAGASLARALQPQRPVRVDVEPEEPHVVGLDGRDDTLGRPQAHPSRRRRQQLTLDRRRLDLHLDAEVVALEDERRELPPERSRTPTGESSAVES